MRVIDGNETDWYRLTEPTDSDDGLKAEVSVTCPHCSAMLKKRNLYLEFTDENGIGTLQQLAAKALDGTGWTLGWVDPIYEKDGETEKIRTYNCSAKTGAYKMIQDLCDKFVAYPVFHGDTMTVDLLARSNHVGMLEMRLDKNLSKMSRTRDSSDIITRLYVEGEYGDLGYVGIDDVNPTGLNYLLNFDYYRSIGALTQAQETALSTYLNTVPEIRTQISTKTATNEANITQLQIDWGAQGYIIYPVSNGAYGTPIYGNGATSDDAMAVGDSVASVQSNGTYAYRTLPALTPAANEAWAVKFVTPCAGTLGGKEVAVEAKQTTIDTLQAAYTASTSDQEKASLLEQINETQATITDIHTEQYALMLACITLATTIGTTTGQIETLTTALDTAEATFATAMGDLLQDGYYSNNTYGPGQEQALYDDSVELMNVLSHPQLTYSLNEIDLANIPGYTDEVYTMNMAVHFVNDLLSISDYGFVSDISEYLDRANTRSVEIKTDELNISSKSFSSFLGRITDAAQLVKDKNAIYDRAKALSANGELGAGKLEGAIDVLKNQLVSTQSNWYTDDNGNLMFESADGTNAMMLSGNGFMVANGKTNDQWNWRTFGTGDGFTADLITAGVLRAGIITILGSDQFFWNEDNIYIFDPTDSTGNTQIRIGRYDGAHLGIAYTTDGGTTWQNAIGFDGVHLSAADQQRIANAGKGGRNYIENSQSLTDAVVV